MIDSAAGPTRDSLDYKRVEKAIRFIELHRDQQPSLEEVAEHVGLSKFHFHRLFQRWAGTTPKRFLQHLTVEHARSLLRESRPVLDTAFASGLSGGSRLHDHFVQVEGVTPGEVQTGGRELRIDVGVHPSPFGDALVASTERGICFLAFLPDPDDPSRPAEEEQARSDLRDLWPEARLVDGDGRTAEMARQVFATVAGSPGAPRSSTPGSEASSESPPQAPLPVHLRGTNFQLQVWRALLRIPPGRVTTYGELARRVGRPGAARAVGSAVGANPVSFLIPCHRVLRGTGAVGGYRWGVARKRAMLAREA